MDLVDDVAEGAAADLAHREPEAAVGEPTVVVHAHDSGVLEAGGELGLGEEAHLDLRCAGDVGAEELHRHHPVELEVVDAPNFAEATGSDAAEVPVTRRQSERAERSRFAYRLRGPGDVSSRLPSRPTGPRDVSSMIRTNSLILSSRSVTALIGGAASAMIP